MFRQRSKWDENVGAASADLGDSTSVGWLFISHSRLRLNREPTRMSTRPSSVRKRSGKGAVEHDGSDGGSRCPVDLSSAPQRASYGGGGSSLSTDVEFCLGLVISVRKPAV